MAYVTLRHNRTKKTITSGNTYPFNHTTTPTPISNIQQYYHSLLTTNLTTSTRILVTHEISLNLPATTFHILYFQQTSRTHEAVHAQNRPNRLTTQKPSDRTLMFTYLNNVFVPIPDTLSWKHFIKCLEQNYVYCTLC